MFLSRQPRWLLLVTEKLSPLLRYAIPLHLLQRFSRAIYLAPLQMTLPVWHTAMP
jgi:hypothetical protein